VTLPKSIAGALGALCLMLLAFTASADAQTGRITGLVTDAQTGEPLPGVQVFLEGTGRGVLTQDNGRYFILNVQPGIYTVTAQLIGYATIRRENVQVSIDVARQIDFQMPSEAVGLDEIVVESERTPLIETRATGAGDMMSLADIAALPVTDLTQALALRSGFLEVPQNTDVIAAVDESRGLTPVRIRGGRSGETLTLIDGVPVNNFVFGGPAFQPTAYAVRQLNYERGGFEAQYGNALSGIINIATREGGSQLEGGMEYRTSAIAGAFGSRPDELQGRHLFQGMLSGPVPGTNDRLRFAFAGREDRSAARVLEFDDEAYDPRYPQPLEEVGFVIPNTLDLWRGWRAFGFDEQRDLFGKLTFAATPAARLNLMGIDYQRQNEPFQFDRLLGAAQPVEMCFNLYGDRDMCERAYGGSRFGDMAPGSVELRRRLMSAAWDHTLGRSFYRVVVSQVEQGRETCNYFQGACLEGWFANTNFNENFHAPGVTPITPVAGTGRTWGGEQMTTRMGRVDVQSQLTDHHNVQVGLFTQRHDISLNELRDRGGSQVEISEMNYNAKPWEFGAYFQDVIEYDFLTVRLGFRFDVGEAGGLFLANPMDPTAGTTAFDVCANPSQWQNVQVRVFDPQSGITRVETMSANPSWTQAHCAANRGDLGIAALIATADDFAPARRRRQFSPRLGLNFPVTESSSMFMNYGRYTQNPLYNNVFQGTGIGTPTEGTPAGLQIDPGFQLPYLGNPNLVIEETTAYEIGYLAEIMREYAFQVVLFSKDQTGLTGLRTGGRLADGTQVFDPGVTYGAATPFYSVLINQDFATSRGFEIGLRRRLAGHWGFDVNYAFSRAMTNASPPDRQFERLEEGEPQVFREVISEIDQPHAFNAALRFATGREPMWDNTLGTLFRNISASATLRAASGLPYTPTQPDAAALGFNPNRREINSERAPSTMQIDMMTQKDWRLGNMSYGAFMHVVNVTDRRNCVQVSPATGRCDQGAYDFLRRRTGNPVTPSSTGLDRPQWIGQRRQILTGARVGF
jgi:hypothetical protein